METPTVDVFKLFEKSYGEQDAKKIITYFENMNTLITEREISRQTMRLATKEDIFILRKEITDLKKDTYRDLTEFRKEFAEFKREINETLAGSKREINRDIAELRTDVFNLKVLIEKSNKELFKWMFVFFVPLYLTLLGFILVNLFRFL